MDDDVVADEAELYECATCGFCGSLTEAMACEATHRQHLTNLAALHSTPQRMHHHPCSGSELREALCTWRTVTAPYRHDRELRQRAAAYLSRATLSHALEQALSEKRDRRQQLCCADKVRGREQRALARHLLLPEWQGAVAAARVQHSRSASRSYKDAPNHFFANNAKMNNERGAKCQGQGKRHQNAAVHATPKAGSGRCAKWSSAKPKRSKAKKKK